jgi:putative hydroxymethylpyrimidine transport system substrate-binding protein
MRARTVVTALLALLPMALAAPGAGAAELQKLRITVPTISTIFYPLYYGQEKGIFAKEGLEIEIISTNGDGPDVDAVISGSAQFAISTPNRLFTAYEQGKPLKAIGMLARRMAIDCAMNKQVADKLGITTATPLDTKLKALKGLTVAGTRPGAFTYVLLDIYGKRVGLTAQKDFQLIGVGGLNSMLPAVENNRIAVGCTGSPFTELASSRQKAIRLTNNARGDDPAFDDFLFEMIYATPEYLKANPDVTRRFLRALFASVREILDTPSEGHMPMLKKLFGGVPDDVLLETFENTKRIYSRDGLVTPGSVEKAGRFMVESGAVKTPATFDQVGDNSFFDKR